MRQTSTPIRVLLPAFAGGKRGAKGDPFSACDYPEDCGIIPDCDSTGEDVPRQPKASSARHGVRDWNQVLHLMPLGSKWQVVIPPAMVYGERGSAAGLDPSAAPFFEIQLIAIE
jgi:hypothetical protein